MDRADFGSLKQQTAKESAKCLERKASPMADTEQQFFTGMSGSGSFEKHRS